MLNSVIVWWLDRVMEFVVDKLPLGTFAFDAEPVMWAQVVVFLFVMDYMLPVHEVAIAAAAMIALQTGWLAIWTIKWIRSWLP